MKIKIEIHCDDHTELMGHLSAIRQQIRHELKQEKIAVSFENSNFLGSHSVKITEI